MKFPSKTVCVPIVVPFGLTKAHGSGGSISSTSPFVTIESDCFTSELIKPQTSILFSSISAVLGFSVRAITDLLNSTKAVKLMDTRCHFQVFLEMVEMSWFN